MVIKNFSLNNSFGYDTDNEKRKTIFILFIKYLK